MPFPTYVTAVGRFGAAIAARLEPSATYAVCEVRAPADIPEAERPALIPWYREKLAAELPPLLRAGATSGDADGQGKLDLVLVADVEEAGGSLLLGLCAAMSAVLAERFAVMFPSSTPPDQRGVGLVVVLATPAVDTSARGTAALRSIAGLERWHLAGTPSPMLNRIYLMPRQNEVMPLSDEDVLRAVYLFVSTATLPGLRETEAIRQRVGPPRDPQRLVDSFAVAAADVDVERVVAAFGWRSALGGLERLAAQCEGRRGATLHAPEVDVASWLAPLADDPPARELKARAGATPAALEQQLLAVDVAEADVAAASRRAVRELVDARLGGDDGLGSFRAVTQALAMAEDRLRALAADPAEGWLPSAASVAAAQAEAAEEAQSAQAQPSPTKSEPAPEPATTSSGALALSAGLLGAITGTAAAAMAAVGAVRASAGAATSGGPSIQSHAAAVGADLTTTLGWGIGLGVAVGAGWAIAARQAARRARAKDDETTQAAPAPQAARNRRLGQAIDGALALRRRRAARAAQAVVEDERRRLDGLRGAVLAAQGHARDRLKDLGVVTGEEPGSDDYARLFDAPTPLHTALVPAAALPRLWERSRAVRDEDMWAARLMARAYPRGGHREDLPFAPEAAWEAALREQHGALVEEGVFAWPDLGAELGEHLRRFLAAVPQALRLGVRPRRADGTPEALADVRELLVIVPPEGRPTVERVLAANPILDSSLLTGARRLSRVLVLRTAGEFDTASLGRPA